MRATERERGFALIALVLVLLTIAALTAVVVARNPAPAASRDRVEDAYEQLNDIAVTAIPTFETDVGRWPASLMQLSLPITTSQSDICGRTYRAGQVGNWAGPYVDRVMLSAGTPIGVGVAQNAFLYEQIDNQTAWLKIAIPQVNWDDATRLDQRVDGAADGAAGTLRYPGGLAADGTVTLHWHVLIDRC